MTGPGIAATLLKACCFEFVQRDEALVRYLLEEFLASIWDRYHHSILTKLGSYLFVAAQQLRKPRMAGAIYLLTTPHSLTGQMIVVCGQLEMR